METTKLSSKGQVMLPKSVRDARHWRPGMEFIVEEVADGVLLRPLKPFKPTRHEDVFGCLKHNGSPLSIEEMEQAVLEEAGRHR